MKIDKLKEVNLTCLGLIALSVFISGCAAEPSQSQRPISEVSLRSIQVPSDPRAQYFLLEKSGSGAFRTLTTKRVGPSETSYAKRLFNCNQKTVKYLADGESLANVRAATSSPLSSFQLAPIVNRSIAYYLYLEACK